MRSFKNIGMLNNKPAKYHFNEGVIEMHEGVPQGGVLSMPMFCDAVQPHFEYVAGDGEAKGNLSDKWCAFADDSHMPITLLRLQRITAKLKRIPKVKGIKQSLDKQFALLKPSHSDYTKWLTSSLML